MCQRRSGTQERGRKAEKQPGKVRETVTELNRSMLVELIDSIYVYQAEGTGKERKQKVEINYRFLAGSQCGIA